MQDSPFDVATWFQSCDTWPCPIGCNLLTYPLMTRHHLTIDLINKKLIMINQTNVNTS